ncbi:hypothetical protein [Hymenobacter guriensis]|uniref:Uncharacterized protein n=1 Tax=Hymenobacter guriensis TaxID=2793065 RepID=A0ABS0L2I5_9BACT|nr:hypothetical protein [Hymenobacter guriensis]MBG8553592.1 hypothetical protein [Hymenobacter guriensis]
MNKVLSLAALLIALGLILYLYQQLNATEKALQLAEKRFADCEQVNFQLQNQLTLVKRGDIPDSLKVKQ